MGASSNISLVERVLIRREKRDRIENLDLPDLLASYVIYLAPKSPPIIASIVINH